MKSVAVLFLVISLVAIFCKQHMPPPEHRGLPRVAASLPNTVEAANKDTVAATSTRQNEKPGNADAILNRKEVPVLTYHHINNKPTRSEYTISEAQFEAHLKMLADKGFHTILPQELYGYLTQGAILPSHPVMLTFDDTYAEHYTVAAAALRKYRFKGVFFIMTVAIGKPGYMNKDQIKALAGEGHEVGCHTWDHLNVSALGKKDWEQQLTRPKQLLEGITGKPVKSFAYPNGELSEPAISELKKQGIYTAYQLSGKRSVDNPLFTIRRVIASGNWSPSQLYRWMGFTFL